MLVILIIARWTRVLTIIGSILSFSLLFVAILADDKADYDSTMPRHVHWVPVYLKIGIAHWIIAYGANCHCHPSTLWFDTPTQRPVRVVMRE